MAAAKRQWRIEQRNSSHSQRSLTLASPLKSTLSPKICNQEQISPRNCGAAIAPSYDAASIPLKKVKREVDALDVLKQQAQDASSVATGCHEFRLLGRRPKAIVFSQNMDNLQVHRRMLFESCVIGDSS